MSEATTLAATTENLPAGQPAGQRTPMEMAFELIRGGADVNSVQAMLQMSRELAAEQAKRAFDAAISAAKAEIPVIAKDKHVSFGDKDAATGKAKTDYWHENLASIARVVDPVLGKHGLSYRFRPSSKPGEPVSVTCIISHRDGYSEETTLSAGADSSGSKNTIQAIGSTLTYLQRYSLRAALGLAVDRDDDGAGADFSASDEKITTQQRDVLLDLMGETNADPAKFCGFATKHLKMEISAIADLPASRFDWAVATIEAGRKPKAQP